MATVMKEKITKLLEWKLRILARWILAVYKPKVIGVTGSVGKTSTKEAIYTVLSSKHTVRKNVKNYNNELGVPLSIIGSESGKKNPFAWLRVFVRGLCMALFRCARYPEFLILEMGADCPGDIAYLTKLAPCTVGVVTAVGQVHTELFKTLDRVVREKQIIVTHLKKEGWAVLNADDARVMGMREKVKANVITFGFSDGADVRALEFAHSAGSSPDPWIEQHIEGASFKLSYGGSTVPVFLKGVLAQHQVYSALAAAAVGLGLGMNLADISEALKEYQSPLGRMKLLRGIKHTAIIDDTYNSSPMATIAALKVLGGLAVSGKKFVILGDMLELGSYTEEGHRQAGMAAAEVADVLVAVGGRSLDTAAAAKESGMPEDRVFHFGSTERAGKFIQERIKPGDIMLIKGSQGSRMERVVKELMAEPERAEELIVRQTGEWQP
ncbi:MAG: UDP-N-acetylmuramoyl-tripeptide--D-alanyl-D-alanine ligase [Patescibacteria group bacterium]